MDRDQFFHERRYSQVMEEFPCKIRFPLFYQARKQTLVIEPGQKLYIPFGWFHMVFSEGDELNFAMNYFMKGGSVEQEGGPSTETPYIDTSELGDVDPMTIFEKGEMIRVIRVESGVFPSNFLKERFKDDFEIKEKTIEDFFRDKDRCEYIMQSRTTLPGATCWLNWGNIRTHLHYDTASNWLHQIRGRKRVVLFPPDDRDLLYMWNPYPMKLIYSLTHDTNVNIERNCIPDDEIKDILNRLGARGTLELPGKKLAARIFDDVNTPGPYYNIWFMIETTIKIKDKTYILGPGDYIRIPNHDCYRFVIMNPTVFVTTPFII